MKTITATDAKQNFGQLMSDVQNGAISIEKSNKPFAVVISSSRYEELKKMEDILYGKAAELALAEGVLSPGESKDILDSI